MPIIYGVSFGYPIPYQKTQIKRKFDFYEPVKPTRNTSLIEEPNRGYYKNNRSSRLINNYNLYNKKSETHVIYSSIDIAA
ncbi:MAG: hypothetical protein FWF57_09995 [Defluviitaleaceae bacterium]|nr:hypothetical protein [Defluviitaleaceae bacterium]